MRKLDYYWMSNEDWYHQEDNGVFVVNDDAPPEAKESYKHFCEQSKYATERIREGYSCD